jgi:beta-phosphoglucomutase-like phosphatase (HAD superfamily)
VPVAAVVFDFDGLLVDTETPEFEAWSQVFQEAGSILHLNEWAKCVGGGNPPWRVDEHLAELVRGVDLDWARRRAHELRDAVLINIGWQTGAIELFDLLDGEGIKYGIASSSRSLWVDGFLQNLGARDRFPMIRTWDMVGRKKPDPLLYFSACEALGVDPSIAVAFEDSPNGILAAKRAGMTAVAVPNSVTQQFDLSLADYQLASLAEANLEFFKKVAVSLV